MQLPPPQAVGFGQDHDAAALGGFIGQGGQLRHVGQFLDVYARGREELHRLAVAQGDGAGFVQEQHVHVARGFRGAAAHGQDVFLHQPVDAGNADGAQEAADGGGNEANQQGGQHRHGKRHAGIGPEGFQGDDDHEEDDGQGRKQDGQGDFVGGLLTAGPFDQADHPVHEAFPRVGGDPHHDFIGEHPGAAGHGAAVAAGLADDRGGFAGDGRFIHGGRALR